MRELSFDAGLLARRFADVGARIQVAHPRFPMQRGYRLDVKRDGAKHEYFELAVGAAPLAADVVDARPDARHLLMLVKRAVNGEVAKEKFLCGHDERAWFVAAVPGASVRDVPTAMEALKPSLVRLEQDRLGLASAEANRRRNAAFVRQGEWFFVPDPRLVVDECLVLRHEPLQRGRSRPHVAEELYRVGGRIFYVPATGRPVTELEYRRLVRRNPSIEHQAWQMRRAAFEVFVRGRVSHVEHKTIVLPGWHRVLPSTENQASQSDSVLFLD